MSAKNKEAELQLAGGLDSLGVNKDDVIAASVSEFEIKANQLVSRTQKEINEIDRTIERNAVERSTLLEKEASAYYKKFIDLYFAALATIPGVKDYRKNKDDVKLTGVYGRRIKFDKDNKSCVLVLPLVEADKDLNSGHYGGGRESSVTCDFVYPERAAELDHIESKLEAEKEKLISRIADTKIKLQKIPMLERTLRGELAKARLSTTTEGKAILGKLQNFQHPLLQLQG